MRSSGAASITGSTTPMRRASSPSSRANVRRRLRRLHARSSRSRSGCARSICSSRRGSPRRSTGRRRSWRSTGLPVGPAKVIDALAAIEAVGLDNRSDFREALAAVLVSRREHLPIFEQAFDMFWRNPRLLEKMIAALLPRIQGRVSDPADDLPARLAQAMLPPPRTVPDDAQETDLDAALSFSSREVLQHKDFATMTVDELAEVKALLRKMSLPLPAQRVRRTIAASRGRAIDLRATLRASVGAGGALTPLHF